MPVVALGVRKRHFISEKPAGAVKVTLKDCPWQASLLESKAKTAAAVGSVIVTVGFPAAESPRAESDLPLSVAALSVLAESVVPESDLAPSVAESAAVESLAESPTVESSEPLS